MGNKFTLLRRRRPILRVPSTLIGRRVSYHRGNIEAGAKEIANAQRLIKSKEENTLSLLKFRAKAARAVFQSKMDRRELVKFDNKIAGNMETVKELLRAIEISQQLIGASKAELKRLSVSPVRKVS